MAFSKTFTHDDGRIATYTRITALRWDRLSKEASCRFSGFATALKATSHPDKPILPNMVALRLDGAKFDQYLSPSALAENADDVIAALYAAARVEPCKSDWGSSPFTEALDV